MGIDYIVRYTDGSTHFLKHDWVGIDWASIFNLLGINLNVLNGSPINYWAAEHVKDMRDMIHIVHENPRDLYKGWNDAELDAHMLKTIKQAELLKDAAGQLLQFFNQYVEMGARIYIQ